MEIIFFMQLYLLRYEYRNLFAMTAVKVIAEIRQLV